MISGIGCIGLLAAPGTSAEMGSVCLSCLPVGPLIALAQKPTPWSALRKCLMDIAKKTHAALRDERAC